MNKASGEKVKFGNTEAQVYVQGNKLSIDFEVPTDDPHPNTIEYFKVLALMGVTHISKGADYGLVEDPFSNVRSSEWFGVPGWIGAIVRANDKMRRLMKGAKQTIVSGKDDMANESIDDSLLDLGVYAGIALVLRRENEQS